MRGKKIRGHVVQLDVVLKAHVDDPIKGEEGDEEDHHNGDIEKKP
jgi:hypothetical protein